MPEDLQKLLTGVGALAELYMAFFEAVVARGASRQEATQFTMHFMQYQMTIQEQRRQFDILHPQED